jgi:hypothetical protein
MYKTVLFFEKQNLYTLQLFFRNYFENLNYKILYINNNKNILLRNILNIKAFFLNFDIIFVCWLGWSDLQFAKLLSIFKKKNNL